MLSLRRTRRWRHSNGVVYEEETEMVHMSAGSGGNSSSKMQALQPSSRRDSSIRLGSVGSVDSVVSSDSAGDGDRQQQQQQELQALQKAEGDGGASGGRMFWHRGGGGFSWSWRRRRMQR
jgi:hypothetical protein